MIQIALLHLGYMAQILPSISLAKYLRKETEKYGLKSEITFVLSDHKYCYINKYNKDIYETIPIEKFVNSDKKYHAVIDLFPIFPQNEKIKLKIHDFMPKYFSHVFENISEETCKSIDTSKMNIFQFYCLMAGLTWKGKGYDIRYFPKNKTKKGRIGISVSNANLRNYVLDSLEMDSQKIWYVPYKKNIFKKMDEINRCEKIVTDDLTTFHLSMSLRKYVYFLETTPLKFKLEMFGNGQIHKVPSIVFQ